MVWCVTVWSGVLPWRCRAQRSGDECGARGGLARRVFVEAMRTAFVERQESSRDSDGLMMFGGYAAAKGTACCTDADRVRIVSQ